MILVFIPIKKVHLVKNGPPLDSAPYSSFTESTERQILFFGSLVKLLVLAVKL